MWQFWLIIAGAFVILEIATMGFLVFWFALGALAALVVSLLVDSILVQAIVFLVVSTILLFATKPLVNKIMPKDSFVKTNSYSIEGKVGRVTIDIEPVEGKGQVKVGGESWSAKSADDTYIPKDTEVIVEKIEGVKVIVKPLTK
ncbi:MAG: NfeD family protein [Clostridia bacterium]|nr:NfeD family protein [Clostridia bacterium]